MSVTSKSNSVLLEWRFSSGLADCFKDLMMCNRSIGSMQSMIAYMTHGSITASLWDDLCTVEGNIASN